MKTRIAPFLLALTLAGCSSGTDLPSRTVADSTCESGQRLQKIAPRLPGIKRYGVRWRDGDCLPTVAQPMKEVR